MDDVTLDCYNTQASTYVEGARGQVWIKANQFKHLDDTWREFRAS